MDKAAGKKPTLEDLEKAMIIGDIPHIKEATELMIRLYKERNKINKGH